jgi:hypothetical protein
LLATPRAFLLNGAMKKAFAALLALTLLGCTDDEAERKAAQAREQAQRTAKEAVTTRFAPEIRKLVAKVDGLRSSLSSVPRASGDGAPPKTDPPMKLSEPKMDDKAGNADVLFQNELTMLQRGMIGTASFYLRQGSKDDSAELLEDVYARALRTRYFLVVRADEHKKPKITGGNSYSEGSIEGDVVVFDVGSDPPKALGSFPISTELTETVKVRENASRESVQYALDEALRKTALGAIEKALAR